MKGKKHVIISINIKKPFYKIQHLFITVKTFKNPGIEGNYLNLIKTIFLKSLQLTSYLMVKD